LIIKIFELFGASKDVSFDLDTGSLNKRLCLVSDESIKKVNPPSIIFESPVPAEMTLVKSDDSVTVKGKVKGNYKTSCARCMCDISSNIEVEIDILLRPKEIDFTVRKDKSFEEGAGFEEDMHTGFYANKQVNLAEIAEEFIVLSLPYSAVCSEDCLGLCVNCGANRNEQNCECKEDKEDSGRTNPFSILKDIKIQ
jgi:uncharacterized protein